MADLVPLLQTVAWILLIVGLVWVFKSKLDPLFEALAHRFRHSRLKGPGFEIGEDLRKLREVSQTEDYGQPSPAGVEIATAAQSLVQTRKALYSDNRGIFLTYVLQPSSTEGQRYDIFIYLIRHHSGVIDDVERAEFFLGSHWGNKVFEVSGSSESPIGIRTSAYGPFLCVCRVHFKGGDSVILHRYVDFEMGKALQP